MSTTLAMPHRLERNILINAPRETVNEIDINGAAG